MEVKINLSDMAYRVEHGFHISNEEARWLLAQVGAEVPRKKRCNTCNATGTVVHEEGDEDGDYYSRTEEQCPTCKGAAFFPADPVEYDVTGKSASCVTYINDNSGFAYLREADALRISADDGSTTLRFIKDESYDAAEARKRLSRQPGP